MSIVLKDGADDGRKIIGYINRMTDELLPQCGNCLDCVIHAQDDLDKWRKENGGEYTIITEGEDEDE